MEEKHITKEELEQILSKYFKTLEQQSKEQEELNKINQEKFEKESQEIQSQILTDEEFRNELISSIKETNINTQYTNNYLFWSIVITGTILVCTLMYKFLKIFF